jgi:hypothetical protein
MQTLFTILTAVIAGRMAIKRGRSGWWGVLAGVIFVVVDTVVGLALIAAVEAASRGESDATFFLIVAVEKTILSALFLGIFSSTLKRAEWLPPESEKKTTLGL